MTATTRLAAATPAVARAFTPTPKRPQLIWNGRERRRAAEPVPAQTLEIVRPRLERAALSGQLSATPLWEGDASAPANRLIWTNDSFACELWMVVVSCALK